MRRVSSLVAALAVLTTTGVTLAQAGSKHRVSQTIKLVGISQSASYPNPGSKSVAAGPVSGSLGSGVVIQTIRITGHPAATTYKYKARGTSFYAHGTIRAAINGTAILQPNGSVQVAGRGRYVGGTDSYRGAHGTFTFSGTIPRPKPNGPAPTVVHVSGAILY